MPQPAVRVVRPRLFGVWRVVAIGTAGGGRLVPPASGRRVELEFAEPVDGQARVSGYAGVNRFNGPYSLSLGEREEACADFAQAKSLNIKEAAGFWALNCGG